MSQSPAKWFLPTVPQVASPRPNEVRLSRRIYTSYPALSYPVQLFWARTNGATPYRQAKRDRLCELDSIRSKSNGAGGPPQFDHHQQAPGPLELAIVLAMGLAFEGSVRFRKDSNAYLFLPCDRPAGVPPLGIYISGSRLHFFVSEEDFKAVIEFAGRGMASFLEAMDGEVLILWHILSTRPLAFGGAERAVETTGVPRDHGFVVWQWHPGGVIGAQGYSRKYSVHSTLAVDLENPGATWLASVEFMEKSAAYSRPTPLPILVPPPDAPRPAKTLDSPGVAFLPAGGTPSDPLEGRFEVPDHSEPTPNPRRTHAESTPNPRRTHATPPVGQDPLVVAEIAKLKAELNLAYINGNPAEISAVQDRLALMEGGR